MQALDLSHLRGWIGRTMQASELLHDGLVQRFNATFGMVEAATGDTAPQLIHFCLAQPAAAADEIGLDGHPARGDFLPPVPLPRRMWAAGGVIFHRGLEVGATITRRSRILHVTEKQGRSGPLCFVTVEHEILSGETLAITERQDIVYRDIAATALPQGDAPQGQHRQKMNPDPVLLLRYSALTFNGHRIHYDRPYATEVELYPGLVVHGPMQATCLARFASRILNRPLRSFRFRSLTPLFDTSAFHLHASPSGAGLRLWTARPDGPVAMEAEAE